MKGVRRRVSNINPIMDKYLLQLKNEFGKYGSWALWDKDGGIKKIIEDKHFESSIKPNIIFMGLNASYNLRKAGDWMNYHFIKDKKGFSWEKEHCRKLAEVLSEPEFSCFSGSYMTDVIKDNYNSNSSKVNNENASENRKLLEREMNLLSSISGSDTFTIICMGKKSLKETKKIVKDNVFEIYHYANWGDKNNKNQKIKGCQKVKERIRQDLRKIKSSGNYGSSKK